MVACISKYCRGYVCVNEYTSIFFCLICFKQKPGNIDEQNNGRCEEQGSHTEREKRLKVDVYLNILKSKFNVQLTIVPTSPPIAKNAMLQRETKVPPIA